MGTFSPKKNVYAPSRGACASLPSPPSLCCCSPSLTGDKVNVATVGVGQKGKFTAQHTMRKPSKLHTQAHGSTVRKVLSLLKLCFILPFKSQIQSTRPLLIASVIAMTRLCKCLIQSSSHTAFRLMIFCSLAVSWYSWPLFLPSVVFQIMLCRWPDKPRANFRPRLVAIHRPPHWWCR